MNTGQMVIDYLFSEMMHVDEQWSIRTMDGFTWWADKNAQTIEVMGTETAEDGDIAYFIGVRTDFLRGIEASETVTSVLNAVLMPFASMAGPVYDEKAGTVKLCSLVRVYEGIRSWITPLIGLACVLQIAEVRIMMHELGRLLGAEPAETGHPQNGVRPVPDDMAEIVRTLIAPEGREPCRLTEEEFKEAVEGYMQMPPTLLATSGGLGFTVDFPYGEMSSLCRAKGDEPHPRYGNGLLLLQSFPVSVLSDADGNKLALSLNRSELTQKPFGYGFGSYCYRGNAIHFTTFIPNVAYRRGLLPNLYFASAQRAREMSVRLMQSEWTPENFELSFRRKQELMERLYGKLRDEE
jgi:hypothetical protein